MGDRQYGGEPPDDESFPWLEPIEEEEKSFAPSIWKVIGLVGVGIVLIGTIIGGYSWWSSRGSTDGNGELIAAPAEPYKIPPDDPGGMRVSGGGDTVFAASEGIEPQGRIDIDAVSEMPITEQAARGVVPTEPPGTKVAAPGFSANPEISGNAGLSGGATTIQLGAFSSEAAANSAWNTLSKRFKYMEPLAHSVIPVKSGEKTLYRLRASGEGAANICGRLRIAGETCTKVG